MWLIFANNSKAAMRVSGFIYWDPGKGNGNYYSILRDHGRMEKTMETTILYWDNGQENGNYYSILGEYGGCIGIMDKKMETTIVYWGNVGVILG